LGLDDVRIRRVEGGEWPLATGSEAGVRECSNVGIGPSRPPKSGAPHIPPPPIVSNNTTTIHGRCGKIRGLWHPNGGLQAPPEQVCWVVNPSLQHKRRASPKSRVAAARHRERSPRGSTGDLGNPLVLVQAAAVRRSALIAPRWVTVGEVQTVMAKRWPLVTSPPIASLLRRGKHCWEHFRDSPGKQSEGSTKSQGGAQ